MHYTQLVWMLWVIKMVCLLGDLVARHVLAYADHELHNHTTQEALRQFAYKISTVQDYRDAKVRRMEDRVVKPLTNYGETCKVAKVNSFKFRKYSTFRNSLT